MAAVRVALVRVVVRVVVAREAAMVVAATVEVAMEVVRVVAVRVEVRVAGGMAAPDSVGRSPCSQCPAHTAPACCRAPSESQAHHPGTRRSASECHTRLSTTSEVAAAVGAVARAVAARAAAARAGT